MKLIRISIFPTILIAMLNALLTQTAFGQQPETKQPADQVDDVVRVNTELVQSDVTVVDRQGHFVDGLQAEQFELRVNGKPQPVSFFERVTAGSAAEERQLSAVRTGTNVPPSADREKPKATNASDRGRVIFFFIDDRHLTLENVTRTRQGLSQFIDNEMLQNDLVAIVCTSGKVGFLQQLTSNKAVLREAITRLTDQRKTEAYAGKTPISEFDADQVALVHNRELFNYLVAATAAEFYVDSVTAAHIVQNRVAQIEAQSRTSTTDTLMVLEGRVRSSAPIPGRKIVFFISGGFVTDPRGSSVFERLHRVTKAAAEVGTVIYTMDARGTFVNIYTDASTNPYPDFTGHVSRNVFAEGEATQESLHTLADATGGRAFLGSNSFSPGFPPALTESSHYYLLAWRPAREEDGSGKGRFTIAGKGGPELKVRIRRGLLMAGDPASVKTGKTLKAGSESTPDSELLGALGSLYPVRSLLVSLSASYNTSDKAITLTTSMKIDLTAFDPASQEDDIDVMGVAIDDRGDRKSTRLNSSNV